RQEARGVVRAAARPARARRGVRGRPGPGAVSLPLRTRLVVLHVTLLAIILAALFTFLVVRLRADLVGGLDDSLSARVAQIALGLRGGGEGEFRDVSGASLRGLPRGESAAQLVGPGGAVLETSGDQEAAGRRLLPG